jgi:hypothetical protein
VVEGVAIGLGREAQEPPKVEAQGGGGTEAAVGGDALDGGVGGFKEALGEGDALLKEPLIGADTKGGVEAAGEGARTHNGTGSHVFDGEFFVEVAGHPGEGCAKGFLFFSADERGFDVLGLAARTLWWDDHAPGDGSGDGSTVILADDVKREVDGGGGSGRSKYLAVVDVEDAGVDVQVRVAGGEFGGPAPVGGDAAAIEQASFSEDEGSGAEGEDARAASIGEAQGFKQGMGDGNNAGAWARNNDDVGLGEIREGVGGGEQEATESLDGARLDGAEEEAIPGDAEFGAFNTKDFGGDAKLKRVDVIVDDGGDGVNGRFLLLPVFSATGVVAVGMAGL